MWLHVPRCVFALALLVGCGGGDDSRSDSLTPVDASALPPANPPPNTDPARWASVTAWKGTVTITESGAGTDDLGSNTAVRASTSFSFETAGPRGATGAPSQATARGVYSRSETKIGPCPQQFARLERLEHLSFEAGYSNEGKTAFDVRVGLAIVPESGFYVFSPAVFIIGALLGTESSIGCDGFQSSDQIDFGSINPDFNLVLATRQLPLPQAGLTLSGRHTISEARPHDGVLVHYEVIWNITPLNFDNHIIPSSCQLSFASTLACESQALSENFPIVGTPYALSYTSDRVSGRSGADSIGILHSRQIAGWNIDAHHVYDSARNQLYMGNSTWRDSVSLGQVPLRSDGTFLIAERDNSQIYVFDSEGRHLKTVNPANGSPILQFAYTVKGYLARIRDGDGNETTIERGEDDTPVAILGPYGHRTLLGVDNAGYLAHITNPAGESIQLMHDAQGLLTRIVDPNGNEAKVVYHPDDGSLYLKQDAVGGFHLLIREAEDAASYVVSHKTALGRVTRYSTNKHETGGEARAISHPGGPTATINRSNDAAESVKDFDGSLHSFRVIPESRFGLTAPVVAEASVALPGGLKAVAAMARSATLLDATNPLRLSALSETWTLNGRTSRNDYEASSSTMTITSPEGRKSSVTLDGQGRPLLEQIVGLAPTLFTYDTRGRLASAVSGAVSKRTTLFEYGEDGNLASVTDPTGLRTQFKYDDGGRHVRTSLSGGRVITYGYDKTGNITSIAPPGRTDHRYTYSPVNQPTSYTPPAVGDGG